MTTKSRAPIERLRAQVRAELEPHWAHSRATARALRGFPMPRRFFDCPKCAATSYGEEDVREGWCNACQDWTEARP